MAALQRRPLVLGPRARDETDDGTRADDGDDPDPVTARPRRTTTSGERNDEPVRIAVVECRMLGDEHRERCR